MKKLTLNYQSILKNLINFTRFAHKNSVVMLTLLGGMLAFVLILNTRLTTDARADEMIYLEEMSDFRNISFDETVIQNIVKLVRNDVTINPNLPNNRNNPFLDF